MGKWDLVTDALSAVRAEITQDDEKLTLTNPENGSVITVYEDVSYTQDMKERFVEYIVCFKTQHCHFEELDDTVPYLLGIIGDEVLPIEFYLEGKRRFGGEITKEEFRHLSLRSLAEQWGYTADILLPYQYEIHSWSGRYDVPMSEAAALAD